MLRRLLFLYIVVLMCPYGQFMNNSVSLIVIVIFQKSESFYMASELFKEKNMFKSYNITNFKLNVSLGKKSRIRTVL